MDARALMLMTVMMTAAAGTKSVEPLYQDVADYVGVPADILYAMSLAESGRLNGGHFAPWPWTLNVAGTAIRYENRQAMFTGLIASLSAGETMIDIGSMQINWYWQFEVLRSPWRITDPTVNIKIGAQILKTHYQRCGDWWEAVGRYHRPAEGPLNRVIADHYRQRVRHFFEQESRKEGNTDAA